MSHGRGTLASPDDIREVRVTKGIGLSAIDCSLDPNDGVDHPLVLVWERTDRRARWSIG